MKRRCELLLDVGMVKESLYSLTVNLFLDELIPLKNQPVKQPTNTQNTTGIINVFASL